MFLLPGQDIEVLCVACGALRTHIGLVLHLGHLEGRNGGHPAALTGLLERRPTDPQGIPTTERFN